MMKAGLSFHDGCVFLIIRMMRVGRIRYTSVLGGSTVNISRGDKIMMMMLLSLCLCFAILFTVLPHTLHVYFPLTHRRKCTCPRHRKRMNCNEDENYNGNLSEIPC